MPNPNDNEWPVGFLESITDEEAQEQLRDPKRWSSIVRDPNGMVCAFGRGKTPRACERWAIKHAGEHAEELWINDERWLLEGWRFVLWPPNEKQGGQALQSRALRHGGGRRWLGMAGRYTGSYLDRPNGWRAVRPLADIGQASLVIRIPKMSNMTLPAWRQLGSVE